MAVELNNNSNLIDLSTVEEVFINGKRYIKYYDNKKQEPVMLNSNEPVNTVLEKLQNNSINFKTSDATHNTMGLLNLEEKYTKEPLKIVKFEELDEKSFEKLNPEQIQIVKLFIDNKDNFRPKLKYINLSEQVAIDENNNVITCVIDKLNNRIDFKSADSIKYNKEEVKLNNNINSQTNNQNTNNANSMNTNNNEINNNYNSMNASNPNLMNTNNQNVNNANSMITNNSMYDAGNINQQEQFNNENKEIEVDVDSLIDNVVYKNIPIEVNGEIIDKSTFDKYYNYQELLSSMSENKASMWRKIIERYNTLEKERQSKEKDMNPPKVLVKTQPKSSNNAGFATDTLTTFVSGFAGGVIVSLILFVIIRVFFRQ